MNRSVLIVLASALCAVLSTWFAYSASLAVARLEADPSRDVDGLHAQVEELRRELAGLRAGLPSPSRLAAAVAAHEEPKVERVAVFEAAPGRRSAAASEPLPVASRSLVADYPAMSRREQEAALDDLVGLAAEGDPQAIALLRQQLASDSELRFEAIESIGDSANPELIAFLQPLTADPEPEARFLVAEALERMPADRAGGLLVDLLADSNGFVLERSLESIDRVGYRDALPAITRIANGSNLDRAARAAAALRRMGDERTTRQTVDRLTIGLSSSDPLERVAAIRRLELVGGDQVIRKLERIVASDNSDAVRLEAQEALSNLREG